MRKIDNLYGAINALIRIKESENRVAIDVNDLKNAVKEEVDVYSATLDWYVDKVLSQAIEIVLNQNGYRSVVRGNGIFVNPDNCSKPEYISRLFNNAKLSELEKQQIVNMMKQSIKTAGIQGQLRFDFETGMILEDITEEDLVRMLLEDATGPTG